MEQALRVLGTGFVAHPANQALREVLTSGQLSPNAYFQQLLRLVYRLLFLLTAEDRNILHDPATAKGRARLRRARRLTVVVRVTFTPAGERPITVGRRVTLQR